MNSAKGARRRCAGRVRRQPARGIVMLHPMGRPLALASAVIAMLLVSGVARSQSAPAAAPPPPAAAAAAPANPPSGDASAAGSGDGELTPRRSSICRTRCRRRPTSSTSSTASRSRPKRSARPARSATTSRVPCILGPGGGVAVRVGWRGTGALYFGGAYELSKQDPNKLLRLAILQQARAEGRYYFVSGRDTEPYLSAGSGVAGYGNEWGVDTWGPAAFVGLGVETQITRRTVVGVAARLPLALLPAIQGHDRRGPRRGHRAAHRAGFRAGAARSDLHRGELIEPMSRHHA